MVVGVINQCFFLALSSSALQTYVFTSTTLTVWTRLFIAFVAENALLALYFAVRLYGSSRLASFVADRGAEALRIVREAYQLGVRLREQRYQLLCLDPATTHRQVCRALDLEVPVADRYLALVRFLDSLPAKERRDLLLDNDASVSALAHRVELARRSLAWRDPGEAPSLPGLLKQLVPVVDLRRANALGKDFREAVWRVWNANSVRLVASEDVDPDEPRAVNAVLQLAACDAGMTVAQARRYTKLCRYVDALGGNPYAHLARMAAEMPAGLLGFLDALGARGVQDEGDPRPSAIAAVVEPVVLARDAVRRAAALRKWMYDEWLTDNYLEVPELVDRVVEQRGSTARNCHRYLLILRYVETLDPQRARAILDIQRTATLALAVQVQQLLDEGAWVDPGEPDFFEWVPPPIPDEFEEEGFLVAANASARAAAPPAAAAGPSGAQAQLGAKAGAGSGAGSGAASGAGSGAGSATASRPGTRGGEGAPQPRGNQVVPDDYEVL